MTRQDWWIGLVLVLLTFALGLAIQTSIVLNEIRAVHEPAFRQLNSTGNP